MQKQLLGERLKYIITACAISQTEMIANIGMSLWSIAQTSRLLQSRREHRREYTNLYD